MAVFQMVHFGPAKAGAGKFASKAHEQILPATGLSGCFGGLRRISKTLMHPMNSRTNEIQVIRRQARLSLDKINQAARNAFTPLPPLKEV